MMMMMQRMMMMVMVIIPVNNCGSASVTVVGPNVQVPGFGLSILDQGPFSSRNDVISILTSKIFAMEIDAVLPPGHQLKHESNYKMCS